MSKPTYIIAGGGTGGHLYPGLAVADQLSRQDPDALIAFVCSQRPIDRKILDSTDYAIIPQPTRPFSTNPLKLPSFLFSWKRSLKLARQVINDLCPVSVLGLGGYASGAIVKRAADRSIPAAILNPDIIPGRANRYLANRVNAIFTQFPETRDFFAPDVREKVIMTGCPTRPHLLEGSRQEACEYFDLYPDRKTLFVFGGSILAESITDTMCLLADDLDKYSEQWQVLMVVGSKRHDRVRQVFNNRTIHARILEYCDRMDLAYAISSLVICRGGAGTVAELSATSLPAIILPYPHHADNQQYRNIAGRLESGAALMVEDRSVPSINAEQLGEVLLPLLSDSGNLDRMKQAAQSSSVTHAASKIAQWMAHPDRCTD